MLEIFQQNSEFKWMIKLIFYQDFIKPSSLVLSLVEKKPWKGWKAINYSGYFAFNYPGYLIYSKRKKEWEHKLTSGFEEEGNVEICVLISVV